MIFTLNKALKIHPLNNATILAGRNGLERKVDLIGILDAPDSVRFVKPNEFVMTTGYIFKENPGSQRAVVEELCKKGAAGLGIKIHRYIANVLPEVVNFANENRFPLIALPNEYSWYELSSPILLKTSNKNQLKSNEFFNALKDVSEKMINANGVEEVLYYLYEAIKMPCSIYNILNNTVLNYPSDFLPPKDIECVIHDLYKESNPLFTQNEVKRIYDLGGCASSAIIAPVTYKSNKLGYMLIWENDRCLRNEELSVLQFWIMSIRLNLKEFHNPKEELMKAQNEFLYKLLSQDKIDIDDVYFRASQLGLKLADTYVVSAVEILEKTHSGNVLPISEDAFNTVRNFIGNTSCKLGVLSCLGKVGKVFFMIPVPPDISTDKTVKTVKAKIKDLKSELESSFQGMIFNFGVGKCYPNLEGLMLSCNEASTSLKLGTKFYGNSSITYFCDLGVYRFLSNPAIARELKSFVDDFIAPLIKFDNENNAELLKTLKLFLECGRSHRQCAKKMFVHHNTVRYRLEQIEKICNVDINSPENLLVLEMAFKILLLDNMEVF